MPLSFNLVKVCVIIAKNLIEFDDDDEDDDDDDDDDDENDDDDDGDDEDDLMLSGMPGRLSASTSVIPAFSPFNQCLVETNQSIINISMIDR